MNDKEKVARWMYSLGYSMGHANTIEDLLEELEWQVALAERDACVAMLHHRLGRNGGLMDDEGYRMGVEHSIAAIRARGKAAEMALEALSEYTGVVTSGTDPTKWNEVVDGGAPALRKAIETLSQALAQLEQEPVAYKEECWACGCEECICATKVPGYYESKIKEAVLAEREACAKLADEWNTAITDKLAAAIRARGEK